MASERQFQFSIKAIFVTLTFACVLIGWAVERSWLCKRLNEKRLVSKTLERELNVLNSPQIFSPIEELNSELDLLAPETRDCFITVDILRCFHRFKDGGGEHWMKYASLLIRMSNCKTADDFRSSVSQLSLNNQFLFDQESELHTQFESFFYDSKKLNFPFARKK